jgi:hypothetical protein
MIQQKCTYVCPSYPKVLVFARVVAFTRVSNGHKTAEPESRTKFNNITSNNENSMLVSEPRCLHAGGKVGGGVNLKENAKWGYARRGPHLRQSAHIEGLGCQLCVNCFNRV